MRCEVVAVGTELLLGQIVDTNSAWLGEQLALAGIDRTHGQTVGDNLERIVDALELALARADAVIVCGGLGPTQDDITRDAIAAVMGVPLVHRRRRGRPHPRAVRRPGPAHAGQQPAPGPGAPRAPRPSPTRSRARRPGLICPVGDKVVYAVPGVPYELQEIVAGAVLPDLARRAGVAVIRSRTLRTWGDSESGLAEKAWPATWPSSTSRRRAPHAGLPRQRHRGPQGAHHGQGRRRGHRCPR